jgi:hypothetical protein
MCDASKILSIKILFLKKNAYTKQVLQDVLDIFNYVFTFIFLLEATIRLFALGFYRYFKEK